MFERPGALPDLPMTVPMGLWGVWSRIPMIAWIAAGS